MREIGKERNKNLTLMAKGSSRVVCPLVAVMSGSCNAADVVSCVTDTPNLGFGVFNNATVFFAGFWVWFLSLQGIVRWTNSDGVWDMLYSAFRGMTSLFPDSRSVRESDNLAGFASLQATTLTSSWMNVGLYIAALAGTLAAGYSLRDSSVLTAVILGLGLLVVFSLQFAVQQIPGGYPVVGGIMMGVVISIAIWVGNLFTLEPGNRFGSFILLCIVIWITITMFAWYGSKRNGGRIRRAGSGSGWGKQSRGITSSSSGSSGPADKDRADRWLVEFEKAYKEEYEDRKGRRPTDHMIVKKFKENLPQMELQYKTFDGRVNVKRIASRAV